MATRTSQTVNNFAGGSPSDLDTVPAIIFSVVLGITIPLLLWRFIGKKHRSKILVNQILFFLTKLGSLIMRSYMSKHQYGVELLIAELLLQSLATLFLANSLIDLWQKSVEHHNDDEDGAFNDGTAHHDGTRDAKWVRYVAMFLRLVLLAAFVSLIAAGAILSRNFDRDQEVKTIQNLVKAAYILNLASLVAGLLGAIITHFTQHRSWRKTAFMAAYAIPLLVSSIYRVVSTFTGYQASSKDVAAFWVAMILFDTIAYGLLLAISIPKWFGSKLHHASRSGYVEKGNTPRESTDTRTTRATGRY